ncbi:beta-aspartyl-peptidase [Sulfidibacter corallicola]|uniref:Isoaspartyl dipeptidase n=1 Tax=Sulfidibacter corallicola TaxID=2818388 RepID=A0A8A4TN49_SULCO|nr:beta-aspartyl-peptidase [Sulfidibacter corallicola]QTD51396.1 beta-aspartyl-peptidase [Sulfidibacter corallicola]
MYLLKNARIFAPRDIGVQDLFLAGTQICAMGSRLDIAGNLPVEVLDCSGRTVIPGLIDAHVHFNGAGGEAGPSSRTAPLDVGQFIEGGVTSAVGCLGMDGYFRSVRELLLKAKGLTEQGLSSWIYTGAYQIPTPTILDSVVEDIALFSEVVGVGELAISDHRSSSPTTLELVKITKQARNGGLLGGKSGMVHLHMGDEPDPFRPIHEAVETTELTYKNFYPTHINRNSHIFKDAVTYGKQGFVDLTACSYPFFPEVEVKPSRAMRELLEGGVPAAHVTISSDAGGSLPHFDEHGHCTGVDVGRPDSILREVLDAVEEGVPMEVAVQMATANPADILKLPRKGRLAVGHDADLVLLRGREIEGLWSRGRRLK